MKATIATLAAAVALSGCVTAHNFAPMQVAPATTQEVLTDVRFRLRDPDAAQFRNVRTFSFTDPTGHVDGSVVCGLVNGRNAFGGYTGFVPFRASVSNAGGVRALYIADGSDGLDAIAATAAPCGGM
jgi:hypothetical protein